MGQSYKVVFLMENIDKEKLLGFAASIKSYGFHSPGLADLTKEEVDYYFSNTESRDKVVVSAFERDVIRAELSDFDQLIISRVEDFSQFENTFLNQLWRGRNSTYFYNDFYRYNNSWLCVLEFSDRALYDCYDHFKGTGKNILHFFMSLYDVLSAKHMIIANDDFGLSDAQYLDFVDNGERVDKEFIDLICAATGFDPLLHELFIQGNYDSYKINTQNFYVRYLPGFDAKWVDWPSGDINC